MPPVFNGSIHSILPSVEFQLDRRRDTLEIEQLAGLNVVKISWDRINQAGCAEFSRLCLDIGGAGMKEVKQKSRGERI